MLAKMETMDRKLKGDSSIYEVHRSVARTGWGMPAHDGVGADHQMILASLVYC